MTHSQCVTYFHPCNFGIWAYIFAKSRKIVTVRGSCPISFLLDTAVLLKGGRLKGGNKLAQGKALAAPWVTVVAETLLEPVERRWFGRDVTETTSAPPVRKKETISFYPGRHCGAAAPALCPGPNY